MTIEIICLRKWNGFAKTALFVICIHLFCNNAFAQNLAFYNLNFENGLSQNSVFAIQQDGIGFMWFGTRFGLNRYDGRNFKVYKYEPGSRNGISDEFTTVLFRDSHKNLWVGSHNGLDKYLPEKDVFQHISFKNPNNEPLANYIDINCMYEDKKGVLWIGTKGGLCQLTDTSYQLAKIMGLTKLAIKNEVFTIYEDSEELLWIGSNNGLATIKRNNNEFYQFGKFNHTADTNSLIDDNVSVIAEDYSHNLWIGTQKSGLDMYDKTQRQFVHYTHNTNDAASLAHNNIRKIIVDKTGKLWIGTQEGLSIIDAASKTITSYKHDEENKKSLSQNSIHSIFQDADGAIWIGTYFGGINITYSGAYTPFKIYQNTKRRPSISNNVISSFVEDEKKNLWIGTEGGGLDYYDKTTGLFSSYNNNPGNAQSLGSNLVKIVYKDFDHNIWIGTHGGGLNLFNPQQKTFNRFLYLPNDPKTIASEITTIIEDKNNHFWVGTLSGIQFFTRRQKTLEPYNNAVIDPLNKYVITILFQDVKNNMWIGTKANGLYMLAENAHELQHFVSGEKTGLRTNNINCITQDSKGNLWVGQYYGGISQYDYQQKKFVTYTEKDGLPNNNVLGILEDDKGNLWISTDNGLSRFDVGNKNFMNYTIDDGLAGNQFNNNSFLKTSDGEMFYGGYNGLTSFYPDKIETNKTVAKVVFTGLELFNKPVEIDSNNQLLTKNINATDELTFRYNQDVFTIEFALLNFIKPNKNKYKYMLQGFDKNWNEVSIPSATYTNLASGNYVLLVKGANNDGIWSETVSMKIKILPPFWKTWWAYCIYFFAVAAVAFVTIRFFWLRELYKKEHEMYRYKIDFFTNISHEIRTHLTLIIGPVEALLNIRKQETYIHQQLKNIKNNADRLLKLVSELLDFRKAETNHLKLKVTNNNIVPFVNEIYRSFSDLAITQKIQTSFTFSNENIEVYFDKEQLEKVFFNLISNAFKFTGNGGNIKVNIQQQKDAIEISVTDNGRGIAAEYLEKLFVNFYQVTDYGVQNTGYGIGLAFSKTIVELHKGTMKVESTMATENISGFTCFSVKMLLGKAHFDEDSVAPELQETMMALHEKMQSELEPIDDEKSIKNPVILIVEDNDEVRKLIYDSLSSTYQIVESHNGMEGWEKGVKLIPDLIISDVMMPEMDGFMLCKKLKTDARTSHIPVLLLTAKTSHDDQLAGLETGADIYIQKPFSIQLLQLNIRNVLATREKLRERYIQEPNLPPQKIAVNAVDEAFLNQLLELIETNIDNHEFTVEILSKKMAMSQPVLYKKIKALSGMSVNDFIISIRLKKAANLLLEGKMNITEVSYAVGYYTPKYFSKEFKKQFGKNPSEYKNQFVESKLEAEDE